MEWSGVEWGGVEWSAASQPSHEKHCTSMKSRPQFLACGAVIDPDRKAVPPTVGGTALRSGSMTAERAHNKDHKIVNFRPACMRACVRACVRASVHACVLTRVRACVE